MANLLTKIMDFRGFDSSRVLVLWGGVLMSMGNSPEMLSRRLLVGKVLVGRLALACGHWPLREGGHAAAREGEEGVRWGVLVASVNRL